MAAGRCGQEKSKGFGAGETNIMGTTRRSTITRTA
jgi:hypothetical protein